MYVSRPQKYDNAQNVHAIYTAVYRVRVLVDPMDLPLAMIEVLPPRAIRGTY